MKLSLPKQLLPGGIAFLCCLVIFPFTAGWLPLVRFTDEEIAIEVYPDHLWMTGIYHYENPYPFPVTQGFSIPLPQDKNHPEPIHVSAALLPAESVALPVYFLLGAHRFSITFRAKERLTVRVKYYQYTPDQDAWYILTTTQPWGRPLRTGRYTLSFTNTHFTTSNYSLTQDNDGTYYFERENFMPQYNWRFSWDISAL